MAHNQAISDAIADLESQESPNISATALKWGIVESTLRRRWKGQTVSYSTARSQSSMLLTHAQESVLIDHINKLSDRGLHPTPQMVENLVVEIVGHSIGQGWIRRFYRRHKNELKSIYLRNIDHARYVADNSRHFQHYFDQVKSYSICIWV